MSLLMKEHAACRGQGPSSYAPIVQALTTLSHNEKARLKRKFDIACSHRKHIIFKVPHNL